MPEITEASDFRGRTVLDSQGEEIGKVDELYYDEQGGQPEWALVNTGLSGTKKTFVPIHGASPAGEDVRVAVTKEQVKDAPRIDADKELSEQEERQLFEHYGVSYTTEGSTTAQGGPRGETGHGSGEDDAMTRSVEELRVGTARPERGRVRLRKYLATEQVQQRVPVPREAVKVEREPITDAKQTNPPRPSGAGAGDSGAPGAHEQAREKGQAAAGQAQDKAQAAAGQAQAKLREQLDQRSAQVAEKRRSTPRRSAAICAKRTPTRCFRMPRISGVASRPRSPRAALRWASSGRAS
jgi:hypothetical protein